MTDDSLPKNDSNTGRLFTLVAIDPDVPSQNNSIYSEFLHWLVVNIPGEDIERGNYQTSSSHHLRIDIEVFE